MVLHFLQCASDPPILPNLQKLYPDFFDYNRSVDDMKLFEELPFSLPGNKQFNLHITDLEVPKNTKTIGELLIGFFAYYFNFEFKQKAISIRRGCIFSRLVYQNLNNPFKVPQIKQGQLILAFAELKLL